MVENAKPLASTAMSPPFEPSDDTRILPFTSKACEGLSVPIPTFPELSILSLSVKAVAETLALVEKHKSPIVLVAPSVT